MYLTRYNIQIMQLLEYLILYGEFNDFFLLGFPN